MKPVKAQHYRNNVTQQNMMSQITSYPDPQVPPIRGTPPDSPDEDVDILSRLSHAIRVRTMALTESSLVH